MKASVSSAARRVATRAGLARLGERVASATLAHPVGELEDRVEALLVWREAFERGALPDPGRLCWPDPAVRSALLEALVHACPAESERALLFVLEETARHHDFRERARVAYLQMALSRRSLTESDVDDVGVRVEVDRLVGDVERQAIARRAQRVFGVRGRRVTMTRSATDVCRSLVRRLCDLRLISNELADGLSASFQPGQDRGTATATVDPGFLTQMAEALASLERMHRFLAGLGRRASAPLGGQRWREHLGLLGMARVSPREIEGVGLSGEIGRMLASEAVLLADPRTRRLFHARWAERSLASYDARSTVVEPDPRGPRGGPVIVLLDTSASMAGHSEVVAKAVVLQLLTTSFRSGRQIVVLSFSGPGDLLEHRLGSDAQGLRSALEWLALSFYGGTVLDTAVARAMELLREDHLADADLLLVTDDGFSISDESRASLEGARREGLRLAGVSTTDLTSNLKALGAVPAVSVIEWADSIG